MSLRIKFCTLAAVVLLTVMGTTVNGQSSDCTVACTEITVEYDCRATAVIEWSKTTCFACRREVKSCQPNPTTDATATCTITDDVIQGNIYAGFSVCEKACMLKDKLGATVKIVEGMPQLNEVLGTRDPEARFRCIPKS